MFFHDAPAEAQAADMARLADLRVFAPFRGQGIASALLQAGEAQAKTVANSVFLTVQSDLSMRLAYERRGYIFSGLEGEELVLIKHLK